jgi:PAS domain S-box-containing protein
MLSCNNAMVLTNRLGQVIHVNTAWCRLTGYELSEVEGKTCRFLHGPETNPELIALAKEDLLNDKSHQMIVMNYRKNGEKFINKVIMVPIHGGYLDASITHYCGLLLPQEKNVKNEMNQQQPHHGGGVEIILNSLPVTSAALNVPPSIVQPTANNNNNNGKAGSSDTTSVTSSNSGSSSRQQQNGSQNGSNSSSNDSNNSGSNRNSSSGSSSNNNVNSSSTSSSSQLKQKLEQVDITEAMHVEPPHKKMKM